jgi:hypothetical protein
MTAATLGHNGGPQSLTDRIKVLRLRKLFERNDLNATQKCVGAWLIIEAGKDGTVTCATADLQTAASVKRRDTVFSATKKLKQIGLIERNSDRGQRGRYEILPEHVVEAVAKAYDDSKSGTVEADRFGEKWSGESGPVDDAEVVRSNRTSAAEVVRPKRTGTVEVDRFNRTSPVEPHQSEPRGRARIENPSGLHITLEDSLSPLTPHGRDEAKEGGGESHVGHGVIVNCETIRHATDAFMISIPALEMRTCGRFPRDEVKQKATAFALQWGLSLERGGKLKIPTDPVSYIAACLMGDQTREQVADIKRSGAKSRSKSRKSMLELIEGTAEVAPIDGNFRRLK